MYPHRCIFLKRCEPVPCNTQSGLNSPGPDELCPAPTVDATPCIDSGKPDYRFAGFLLAVVFVHNLYQGNI
jgi:hypothetical protein